MSNSPLDRLEAALDGGGSGGAMKGILSSQGSSQGCQGIFDARRPARPLFNKSATYLVDSSPSPGAGLLSQEEIQPARGKCLKVCSPRKDCHSIFDSSRVARL